MGVIFPAERSGSPAPLGVGVQPVVPFCIFIDVINYK